jgi:hypothetical protein
LADGELHTDAIKAASEDAGFLAAHKRAQKILNSPQHRVSADAYVKKYGKEEVEKDMNTARELRAKYESERDEQSKEAYMLAEIFEAIVLTEGQESGWLGDDVKIQKTTDYDDMRNHTDMIATWRSNRPDAHSLGLAVDVTFGARSLEKKFDRLQEDIDKGKLAHIKYAPKEQSTVPRVIVGMSREVVHELVDLWMEEDFTTLAEHPIQREVLEQIYAQLQAISAYALKSGQHHVADVYKRSIQTVRALLNSKSDVSGLRDRVSAGIQSQISKRFAT